jgi:tRNA1(Val) A37 N6-methylase TrmN6
MQSSKLHIISCRAILCASFWCNQLHQHQKEAHKIARHEIMCSLEDCMFAARHLLKLVLFYVLLFGVDEVDYV